MRGFFIYLTVKDTKEREENNMEKSWKTAPWQVRVLLLYWIFPFLVLLGAFGYFIYVMSTIAVDGVEVSGMWRMPLALFEAEFNVMPINTSIDMAFVLIALLGAYYAWHLLKGSYISRSILELFSWLILLIGILYTAFPELEYFELESIPVSLLRYSIWQWTVAIAILFVELVALLLVRSQVVRRYVD